MPKTAIPLRNVVSIELDTVPTEVTHYNIQPTIELTMGVYGRDLGHVSDDVTKIIDKFGETLPSRQSGHPTTPTARRKSGCLAPRSCSAASTYAMQDTFGSLVGLTLGLAA